MDALCTEFGCLLEQLKQRESLADDAAVHRFLRKQHSESARSFSDMRTVKLLSQVSDSVCLISVAGSGKGTGFLLFDRFILTNAHVIREEFDPGTRSLNTTVTAVFDGLDMGKELQVKSSVVAYCHETDWTGQLLDFALLELSDKAELPVCSPLLSSYSPPPTKGGICVVGHPDGGAKLMDPCFLIEKQPQAASKSGNVLHIVSKMGLEEGEGKSYEIMHNSWFFHGSSGSPVFSDSCKLIGIHSGGYAYKDEGGETRKLMEYALPMLPILVHILKQATEKGRADVVMYFKSQGSMKAVVQAAEHLKDKEFSKSVETFNEVSKVKLLMELSSSVCMIKTEGTNAPLGTGFLFAENYILTSAQVIGVYEPFTKKLQHPVTAQFGYESSDSQGTEVEVKEDIVALYHMTKDDTTVDFALLELSSEVDYTRLLWTSPKDIWTREPKFSGGTCIIGHPDGGIKKLDFGFIIEKDKRDQAVQQHLPENPQYLHIITQKSFTETGPVHGPQTPYNSAFLHGSSGSPVFNESCELIGVHTGRYVYQEDGGKIRSVIECALPITSLQNCIFQQPKDKEGGFVPAPFKQILPEGLRNETLITIRGRPTQNPTRFGIDFRRGEDIDFHLNPRFNDNGQKVIVRNSFIGGHWGSFQTDTPFFPFTPGESFEIKILSTKSEFKVEVNGRHILNYNHRITDLADIKLLHIVQDIEVQDVHIGGNAPRIHFEKVLPGGLKDGTLITIRGKPTPNPDIFKINFYRGDDIAFHLNSFFNDHGRKGMARGTFTGGYWGPFETRLPFFPFTPGEPFEMKILCTKSEFRVEVNGMHMLNYKHRITDLENIKLLHIFRDIELQDVHTGGFVPRVPFKQILPEGLTKKTLVTIRGRPTPNPSRFAINFCRGDDIAFHLNPRFCEKWQNITVRNSFIGGHWGSEEKDLPFFPFTPGEPFEMKILCTRSEFKVEVNSVHMLNYKHRITDLANIKILHIGEDIELQDVHIGRIF